MKRVIFLMASCLLIGSNGYAKTCFLVWCRYSESEIKAATEKFCNPVLLKTGVGMNGSNAEATLDACDGMVRELLEQSYLNLDDTSLKAFTDIPDFAIKVPANDAIGIIRSVVNRMMDLGYEPIQPQFKEFFSWRTEDLLREPSLQGQYFNAFASKILIGIRDRVRKK